MKWASDFSALVLDQEERTPNQKLRGWLGSDCLITMDDRNPEAAFGLRVPGTRGLVTLPRTSNTLSVSVLLRVYIPCTRTPRGWFVAVGF
ncbi:hypothetical protein EVAR_99047_1 [Eumeta japonica]|uniref:Uncharacterized protein n=1 Tax=Eumeta variegata TaxID=151549 RepID=A0A4C1XWP0_EUMVA|nr:hypothetical protein EVAR_99047_1 [Eumeta japonica]